VSIASLEPVPQEAEIEFILTTAAEYLHKAPQRSDVLSAFAGKRRIDGFTESVEKPKPWTFYGRLGVLNFQNELEPERSNGMRFTLRRTGPRLTGRVYIGIHRSFH